MDTLATVDQLSGGRLIAGLALGAWQDRYPAFGLTAEHRVRRFGGRFHARRHLGLIRSDR